MDGKEAAVRALSAIYEAWGLGVVVDPEASVLLPLLESGRLTMVSGTECEYRLQAPIEQKNGERLEVVKFSEPAASDLEYIRSGVRLGADGLLDLGAYASATLKALIKTGGLITGLADRIKARDLDTLSGVLAELGFFGR